MRSVVPNSGSASVTVSSEHGAGSAIVRVDADGEALGVLLADGELLAPPAPLAPDPVVVPGGLLLDPHPAAAAASAAIAAP